MKTHKYFCFLLLHLLFLSCNNKKKEHITDYFSQSEKLKHEVFTLSTSKEIFNPGGLMIYDSLLILKNMKSPSLFSLINMNQKKLIKNFGDTGEGPGEFIMNLQINKVKFLRSINAPDLMLTRMYQYSIDSLLSIKKTMPIDLFSGTSNRASKYQYTRILQINDSIFIGIGGFSGGRFMFFNVKNKDFCSVGEYPDKIQLSDNIKSDAYQGYLGLNEYNHSIVFASQSSEMLEFFKFKENKILLQKGYYTSIPSYSLEEKGGAKYVKTSLVGGIYLALTYTKKSVYLLYSPKKENASFFDQFKGNCVLVFNWEGKPIKKYQLDCEVKTIEINEDGSRIYAIRENPDPEIIYFEIDKESLRK